MIDDYVLDKDYLLYLKNKKSDKKYIKFYKKIYDILNSDEYYILLEEYSDFVNNIYNLFLELNITSSLDVALFYNKLLFEGIFSSDYKFSLNDSVKYDFLIKTWGSRVCTGNSVCRHNVMLLLDLERKFNNDVECVDLISVNPKNKYKNMLANFDSLYINHLAIGLKDKDKIYVYDPTNYVFLLRNGVNNGFVDFLDYDEDFKKVNELRSYYNINESTNKFNYKESLSISDIDKNYITNLFNYLEELYKSKNDLLNEFHLDNSKKIRKIKYLNNEIVQKQNRFK